MAHLRYPQDLFKVQRELLTRYHVTDAAQFYSGSDAVAGARTTRPTRPATAVPPYYLSMKMPDQNEPDVLADDDLHAERAAQPAARSWRSTPTPAARTTARSEC